MISSHVDALGIIFPNSYDGMVPDLVIQRSMASIPVASRYRMIDFPLSSMANSGIDNVSVIVRKNYHSLMDHLGSGREWDLSRKNGGLNIVPPFASRAAKLYHGRVEALFSILSFLRHQKEKYVVMTDSNILANIDFTKIIKYHIESKADITLAYTHRPLTEQTRNTNIEIGDVYYGVTLDGTRVCDMKINPKSDEPLDLCMNVYVIERSLLIEQIEDAYARGNICYERDVLLPNLATLNVQAYEYTDYVALISNMKAYFDENMKLLDEKNADALFSGDPIYTKIRDDNPTRYTKTAKVSNTMAADGCVIEGTVENCILFRGVKIKKGAVAKNCILMQDTVLEENSTLEYVITDKNVTVSDAATLQGSEKFPVFIAKGKNV